MACVLFMCVIIASHVNAQPPEGSYKQTCNNISVSGDTLSATCKKINQEMNNTTLQEFHLCIGDVSNINGVLRCNKGTSPPQGSYRETCRFSWVDQNVLHSSCKNRNGQWQDTQLAQFGDCVGEIANFDGQLRCNKGGVPPQGSYQQTCRDTWVDGNSLHSTCKTLSGKWKSSKLDNIDSCRTKIANIDGFLTCDRGSADAPPGTYRKTCRDIVFEGKALSAVCKTFSGSWRETNIDSVAGCQTKIGNIDGYLTCDRGGVGPEGSYKETCRDIVVDSSTIKAKCRKKDGTWNAAKLSNYGSCISDISNNDGSLECSVTTGGGGRAPSETALKKLTIINCDADRNRMFIWIKPLEPSGRWRQEGEIAHGYVDDGPCPQAASPSHEVSFDHGSSYGLMVVFPDRDICNGQNNPEILSCRGLTNDVIIKGDNNGLERTVAYPQDF